MPVEYEIISGFTENINSRLKKMTVEGWRFRASLHNGTGSTLHLLLERGAEEVVQPPTAAPEGFLEASMTPPEPAPCPDGQLPDGPVCPACGGDRAPSGVDGGSWVHFPRSRALGTGNGFDVVT